MIMRKSALFAAAAAVAICGAALLEWSSASSPAVQVGYPSLPVQLTAAGNAPASVRSTEKMSTTSTISSEMDAYDAQQNTVRSAAGLALDYNALTSTVPAGGNAVSGLSALATSGTMNLGGTGYNTLILAGSNSVQAAATGAADNWALSVPFAGSVTLLDENTGKTLSVTGDAYLVFNGGVTNSDGSYNMKIIGGGNFADVALMYDAAFGRQPDLPGLEFYAAPIAAGTMSLHQAAVYFLASPEFANLYLGGSGAAATIGPADNGGPNDVQFIDKLYGQILHRAPNATEVAYYVDALQGKLVVNGVNVPAADRATLLIYFSISQENQHNSTWLVNTDNGAYQDAGYALPGSEAASTALAVTAGGTINTGSIDLTSISGGSISVNGGFGSAGVTVNTGNSTIFSGEAGITIDLSTQIPNANLTHVAGDTVYVAPNGGSDIQYQLGGNTIYLSGAGNILENPNANSFTVTGAAAHAAPVVEVVYGMVAGDVIAFDRTGGANGFDIIGTPAAGTKIQGASLLINSGAVVNFGQNTIAINVGPVADNTAATMAAAASEVYQPSSTGTGNINNGSESVIFFGEGQHNDTVIYKWVADSTHTVSATTMVGGVDLIGVSSSHLIGNGGSTMTTN